MKRLIILITIIGTCQQIEAQRNADIGILLGASSYLGEINPVRILYKPSPSVGGFFRFNIDKRYAVRLSGYYITLRGNTSDFPDRNYPGPGNASFANRGLDIASQLEFNFLPYITGERKYISSTYLAGGLGFMAISGTNGLIIPFGIGVKLNLGDRLSSGIEWSFRKTFNDNIDNLENQLGRTLINNNDWYSILGLFISYKFVKFAADCPVYN
jgi:hypothetical protein